MPALKIPDAVFDLGFRYGFEVLGALVILVVGLIVARWTGKMMDQRLQKQAMEPPLRILIVRVVKVLVDRKSTRLNSSHLKLSRMPSSA